MQSIHLSKFRIRQRIQIDGRFFADSEDGNAEFTVRRLRPVFQVDF